MTIRIKYLTIIFSCLVMVFVFISFMNSDQKAAERPMISDGEYAKAWVSCQNLMSIHNYYHGVNHNLEELAEIWVKEDGAYAKTATFSQPGGVWEGIQLIKVFYGNPKTKDPNQSLKEMVKNEPSAYPVGTFGIHMNTTPVIIVAGDGKSAKGIWYSPGPIMSYTGQKDKDGNDLAGGMCFFEKYGADFVKEDGVWKIWHIQMFYDYVFPIPSDWSKPGARQQAQGQPPSDQKGEKAASPSGGMPQQVKPTRANPNPYAQWSPTRVSTMEPKIPVPYYTFSETFSY
jgi:hypothetical protein